MHDVDVDVVVVGSGAAGLTAALTARMQGLSVVLVEKADVLGGTTAISGGALWIPCSAPAIRANAADSLEQAQVHMRSACADGYDERKALSYLRAGPQLIEMLERRASIGFTVAMDRPDYYSDKPGGSIGGRCIFPVEIDGRLLGEHINWLRKPLREMTFLGMMMRPASDLRHFLNAGRSFKSLIFVLRRLSVLACDRLLYGRSMNLAGGNALIAHLLHASIREGVVIYRSTAAKELLVEGGRVTGVLATSAERQVRFSARRGVVLAAGGFPHNLKLRGQHYPHPSNAEQHVSPAPASNTGDGIEMALKIGAVTPTLSDACCWAPVSVVPHRDGTRGAFPHLIDRQNPGFIAVTHAGKRFVNESHSYHEFGRGLIRATSGQSDPSCFLLADHRAVRQYGMGFAKPAPVPVSTYVNMGYLVRATTIRELAIKLGIDPKTLGETVERFNEHALRGEDPEFGRGSSPYNRYLGNSNNKPNPCVAPLETAPFYAVRIHMGELGTFAGLETNEHAQVLKADGSVIEGLYAAGNDMSHVMGGNYLGGGSAIGPCAVFGYIAALHMSHSTSVGLQKDLLASPETTHAPGPDGLLNARTAEHPPPVLRRGA